MTDFTSYSKLGVTEDASFEEIKDARDRLIVELDGDATAQELVEAAYDAILMDRLRARQEGKIKVPDRIRFPEKNVAPSPTLLQPVVNQNKLRWLSNLKDNPSRQDFLLYSGVFSGLLVLSILLPNSSNIWMALALLASVYFLRRKENRFWRSLLLAMSGLVLGVVASLGLLSITATSPFASQITTGLILLVMWLVTTLLR
jgi:Protein CHAPERONE-LIKE PROTEIN OF POR1-like